MARSRKAGCSERGTKRKLACRNGMPCDVTVMGMPRRESPEKHGNLPKKGAV